MLSLPLINYTISIIFTMSLLSLITKVNLTNYLNINALNNLAYLAISNILFILIFLNFYIYNIFQVNYDFSVQLKTVHSSLRLYYFPFIYLLIFITLISVIFCLNYSMNEITSFLAYITIILISGISLFLVDSLIFFFFFYECLLIPSFVILYKYSKTRKSVEASYLMFFWTQFGALLLIFAFTYIYLITNSTLFSSIENYNFSKFEINFIFILLLFGFGVKLPLWPFYDWLPKAHVEASTNFSIFLSGVLVKFAFFGLLKCLLVLEGELTFYFIFPYLLMGMVDSVLKIFHQIDIKKVIAYATVAEMHWLVLCIVSGNSALWYSGFFMLISHAIMSTNSFLLVDSISRRFKTRLLTEISGINFLCPKLYIFCMINLVIFLGFPGTIFFLAEVVFFTYIMDLFPIMFILLMLLVYLLMPLFFFIAWKSILFGEPNPDIKINADLDKVEVLVFSVLNISLFWLGFTAEAFIF